MRGPRWDGPVSIAARPKIDNHFGNLTHLTIGCFPIFAPNTSTSSSTPYGPDERMPISNALDEAR